MFGHSKNLSAAAAAALLLLLMSCATSSGAGLPPEQAGNQSAAKPIGAIKSIEGNTVTLASDSGALFTVPIEAGVKILRIEPGAKDLKNAEPLQPSDLQVGDRILVLGKVADDGHSVAATAIVVMKKADVASKQERERQDWQRRGVGGLVTAVDATAGTIAISTQSLAGSKNVTVHVGKDTVLRRYAPDSVKFDDAKISSIDQVKPGDQLRARGTRSADGSEMAAEEIVSGAFQNIPGTVVSVDASAGNVTVANLISKKNVVLKVTPESQLRKLPPPLAQMMVMRLKGAQAGGSEGTQAGAAGGAGRGAGGNQAGAAGNGGGGGNAENPGRGRNGGGGGDFQQILGRLPAATPGDLQKGDAVMIVATEGSGSGGGTVITLLAGVEPLLAASPSMVLPPWSLDTPGGGDAGQ